jgi:beta-aspartyl-peptidase (threonine type)
MLKKNHNDIAIVIHGGASSIDPLLRDNEKAILIALEEAVLSGYEKLSAGHSSTDAVEAAVRLLEDCPFFNCAKGSCLNAEGQVEMDACMMQGKDLKNGAVTLVRNIKNPVSLARQVMDKTSHTLIGGEAARKLARILNVQLEPDDYFITPYRWQEYEQKKRKAGNPWTAKVHGTVGAVALDKKGNVAAAASSGGTAFCLPGRIGDSCMAGIGCYADNKTCAVACTGDGEYLVKYVMAHSIAMVKQFTNCNIQDSCDHSIQVKHRQAQGDLGAIAIDCKGNIGISFNSERMPRAWIGRDGKIQLALYK